MALSLASSAAFLYIIYPVTAAVSPAAIAIPGPLPINESAAPPLSNVEAPNPTDCPAPRAAAAPPSVGAKGAGILLAPKSLNLAPAAFNPRKPPPPGIISLNDSIVVRPIIAVVSIPIFAAASSDAPVIAVIPETAADRVNIIFVRAIVPIPRRLSISPEASLALLKLSVGPLCIPSA